MTSASLEAGRGMDERVAREVLGWALAPETNPPNRSWAIRGPRRWRAPGSTIPRSLPAFSTEIAAAWLVVEALRVRGIYIDLSSFSSGYAAIWSRAGVGDEDIWMTGQRFESESAPLAICLAALDAIKESSTPISSTPEPQGDHTE